jgi:hypothetical protein
MVSFMANVCAYFSVDMITRQDVQQDRLRRPRSTILSFPRNEPVYVATLQQIFHARTASPRLRAALTRKGEAKEGSSPTIGADSLNMKERRFEKFQTKSASCGQARSITTS